MMECIPYSRLAVPLQTVQEIPDRMVGIPASNDMESLFDHLQLCKPISPRTVKMDIVQIIVGKSITIFPIPSKILNDIYTLCQFVEADAVPKKRIIRHHDLCVRNRPLDHTLVGCLQHLPDIVLRLLRHDHQDR